MSTVEIVGIVLVPSVLAWAGHTLRLRRQTTRTERQRWAAEQRQRDVRQRVRVKDHVAQDDVARKQAETAAAGANAAAVGAHVTQAVCGL